MLFELFWRIFSFFAGLGRCLVPARKSRRAAAGCDEYTAQDMPSISVESSSSVNADSAVGIFHDAQESTLSTGSVCFTPAKMETPTPSSKQSLRTQKVSAANLKVPPSAATPRTAPPVPALAPPTPARAAFADITALGNGQASNPYAPAPTPATATGSVASCCPSPLADDYATPADQQPLSLWNRFVLNSGKVVGVANTQARYMENKPIVPHMTPYAQRLEKQMEEADKVEERLATSREKEAVQ